MSCWPTRDAERVIHRVWHVILTRGWFAPEEVAYLRRQVMLLLTGGDELPEEHAACLRGLLFRLEEAAAVYEREPER